MKQDLRQEKDFQDFFKKLDLSSQRSNKVIDRFGTGLCVLMGILLAATYLVALVRGTASTEPKQLILGIMSIALLVLAPLWVKMFSGLKKLAFHKDHAMDPVTMVLPERGTVTLENALHKMSLQTGVIVWDMLWGCVLFSLLFLLLMGDVDQEKVLRSFAMLAALTAAGHLLLRLYWKKRSFTKRMILKSREYFPAEAHEDYADLVDASLKRCILSYERELVLTDDYILGVVEWDANYVPVAVPRAKVTEYVFSFRRMVRGGYTRTFGILSCRTNGKTLVELVLGVPPKAQKILRILDYYQIPWIAEELRYL